MADLHVYIIDDDEAVAGSLYALVSAHGYLGRSYPYAEAFLHRLHTVPAGCAIVDLRLPGLDGMELLKLIRGSRSDIQVIVVTGHGDIPQAVKAMRLGAIDFLEKPYPEDELLRSLSLAFSINREIEDGKEREAEARKRLSRLSPREHEVLRGLLRGGSNKSVGLELGISARTVEVHRANLMYKLGAQAFPEVVRLAFVSGEVDIC